MSGSEWTIVGAFRQATRHYKKHWIALTLVTALFVVVPLSISKLSKAAFAILLTDPSYTWLLGFGLDLIMLVVGPYLGIGFGRMHLRVVRGERPSATHFRTDRRTFGRILITTFLCGVPTVIGLVLGVVPGLVLMCGFAFANALVVDQQMKPLDAIKASWNMAHGQKVRILLFVAAAFAAAMAGFVLCGVGMFVSISISWLAMSTVYEHRLHEMLVQAPSDDSSAAHGESSPERGRSFWLSRGLVVVLGGLVSLLALSAIVFVFRGKELEPTSADLERLLRLEDLQSVGYPFTVEPGECTTTMVKHIFGSTDITYQCTPADQGFSLLSTVSYERSPEDALFLYQTMSTFLNFGVGGESVPAAAPLEWGDESTLNVMTEEGAAFGFQFRARRGNDVLMYMVVGVDTTELAPVTTAIRDRLEAGF